MRTLGKHWRKWRSYKALIDCLHIVICTVLALLTGLCGFATVCYQVLGLVSFGVIASLDITFTVAFLTSICSLINFSWAYKRQTMMSKKILVFSAFSLPLVVWLHIDMIIITALTFVISYYLYYISNLLLEEVINDLHD